MESRARNTFVLLTIVSAFALQCISAEQGANQTIVEPLDNKLTTTVSPTTVSSPAQAESSPSPNNNVSAQLIEIKVYYEALCQDSVNFVSNNLLPVYNKLSKFINVTFIPFAQGNFTINPDNSLNLICKRVGECAADKVHACGINKIKENEKLIKFVNCSLTEGFNDSNKTVPIDVCGKNSSIDNDTITQITKCANSTESDPWLQGYKNQSSIANVTNVPKIFVNKNHIQDFTFNVLMKEICYQIPKNNDFPAECKSTDSGSDTLVVGVLPIIIGAFYFMKMI